MKRALPFAGGAAAVAAAALALGTTTGADDACAQSGDPVAPRIACPDSPRSDGAVGTAARTTGGRCATTSLLRSARVAPAGRGVRVAFVRGVKRPVHVSVFQSATRRTVVGERLVYSARRERSPVRWSGRRQRGRIAPRDGTFFVRVAIRRGSDSDVRRFALRRSGARFRAQRTFARRDGCGLLRAFKLERPAFGGRSNRAVSASFRLAAEGRVVVDLLRDGRAVRRLSSAIRQDRVLHRVRVDSEGLRRGRYEVRLRYAGSSGSVTRTLFLRRV